MFAQVFQQGGSDAFLASPPIFRFMPRVPVCSLVLLIVVACASPRKPPTDADFVANPPAGPAKAARVAVDTPAVPPTSPTPELAATAVGRKPATPKPPPQALPPPPPPASVAESAPDESTWLDDDFSRGNHCDRGNGQRGFGWGVAQHGRTDSVIPVRDEASPSGCALAFIFQGNADPGDDSWAEQRFKLGKVNGDAVRELFVGFVIHTPANYVHRQPKGPDNNKLLRIWDREYSKSTVHLGMSTVRRGGGSAMIVEYSTAKGTGTFNTGPWNPVFRPGSADTVGFLVRLSSATDTPDGRIRVWWNRRLVYDHANLPLAKAQRNPGAYNGLGNGYLLGWANSGFTERTELHVWRFILAPQPVPWFLP